ncbi:YgfZ/GcvT domain-containing protein [Magnetospirillum aberrantis]|uniref:Folate-binding protein YgfZ n=1 Tax=Magnetospirillum aberrantis SpK TaxID=908842 RepID=A0A7C9QUB9_9PROT|nr:folate-binding protein YgfZ [Magnetospirillum aberrantis]NFV80259.1 folate-binding protein YgfZ [Magnetospirillum aberrantis SpK]
MPSRFIRLDRAVLSLSGDDRFSFLQGLVSNDVNKAAERAIWAAFLTPQGKFLYDLFVVAQGDTLLVDVEAGRAEEFRKKLSLYKLRAKVAIAPTGLSVFAVTDAGALGLAGTPGLSQSFGDGIAYVDPRLTDLGARVVLSSDQALVAAGLEAGEPALWDAARIAAGIPDGSRDMAVDKALLLENGFDELGGVDFEKGCYMGQELTARTKYRGLVKKRLLPVTVEGAVPPPGTVLTVGGAEAGEMRSSCGQEGVALVRLEHLNDTLLADGATIRARVPHWVKLPEG